MKDSNQPLISIILPLHNGESTIIKTLESLIVQSIKFHELIIIDDASSDSSVKLLQKFLKDKKIKYKSIKHNKTSGLAKSYNDGIMLSTGDLIVTLHQDVVLMKDSLEKLIAPFDKSETVATSHIVMHPIEIWNTYNFWQKCFFARLVGKDFSGIDGKFDCFLKKSLLEVGLFDEKNFRSAGEDGDMLFKLKKHGKIIDTPSKIIHLHKISSSFSYKDIIYKQKQYSEAQGALLALGRIRGIKFILKAFFREVLLLALLIPYVQILAVLAIVAYQFYYSKIMFLREYKDKRILIVPVLNIYLLFVSLVYSFKGFIYGKQKI